MVRDWGRWRRLDAVRRVGISIAADSITRKYDP